MSDNERLEATVEELKEKIEEINQNALITIERVSEEEKEKIKNIKDEAIEAIEHCIQFIKQHYEEIKDNEEMQKIINTTKEKTIFIYNEAKEKIVGFVHDPKVNDTFDHAMDTINDISTKTYLKVKEGVDSLKENEELMSKIHIVKDEAAKGVKTVKDAIDDFATRPNVQQKVDAAKDKTINVAEKAVDALKSWLKPKEEEKPLKDETNLISTQEDKPKE